jgi:23S rRNA (guanosine2251-2'-O)-methyltransferase
MLVYGRNVALEILEKKEKVKKIILQDDFNDKNLMALIEASNLPVEYLSKREIGHLVDGVTQGIILDIPDYKYLSLNDLLNREPTLVVILDHLEDPHNLGAIIRTSEAAGVDAIIIPRDRQIGVNATVMKTSAGALTNIDIVSETNLVNTISKLKEAGFWIVGSALDDNSVDFKSIDYSGKIALVIGNEGAGMSSLVKKNCDFIAKIPMYGKINSLNASVAAGLMIYEVVRNRK